LPKIIEDLTIAIEAEINKSFSTQEIEEIIEIAQKPIIKKLLSNQIIFGLLKKYEIEADYQSNLRNYQDSLESNAINSMNKEILDLKKKYGIEDFPNRDREDPDLEDWENDGLNNDY
jgi:hypothetical protein